MVKSMVTKKVLKIPSKPSKPKRKPKSSKSNPSPSADQNLIVNQSSLAWNSVRLPTEALAGGVGITQSELFNSLNWDDDDFMGLQEIDGVEIIQQPTAHGGRKVQFKAATSKLKQQPSNQEVTSAHHDNKKSQDNKKRKRTSPSANVEQSDLEVEASDTESHHSSSQSEEQEERQPDQQDRAAQDHIDWDDQDIAEAFRNVQDLDMLDDDDDEQDADFNDSLLPEWSSIPLHPAIKRALHNLNFIKPTQIQSKTLPHALGLANRDHVNDTDSDDPQAPINHTQRDVIGVSQTGSGKTLAYALPILQYLLDNAQAEMPTVQDQDDQELDDLPSPLGALIITPTRELAIQVSTHLTQLIKASCRSSPQDPEISKRKLLSRPQVAVVCGGMSEQKQKRMIQGRKRQDQSQSSGGADIIVATPGRLWEMTRLDDHLAARIKRTRFLVLDEADRMVEVGHFAEMENILNLISRSPAQRPSDGNEGSDDDDDDDDEQDDHRHVQTQGAKPNNSMQTFIFSATLSKNLQVNLKKRKMVKMFKKKKGNKRETASTLDELMERVDFRDKTPLVIDLTPGQGMPQGLIETKVECLTKEKDLYLYYFLLRYPGRTLVFLNSIDGIRRLTPILSQLNLNVHPIHSQLQQKQRLKSLDRFRANKLAAHKSGSLETSSVLLATDVAARGLDIPSVDHVVHYQLPRSADTYVHRSGRTARAGGNGVSVALIDPKEKNLWIQLCKTLKRSNDIPMLPTEYSFLTPLGERLQIAREIDSIEHRSAKASHEESWLRTLAQEVDIDIDSDNDHDPDAPRRSKSTNTISTSSSSNKEKAHRARIQKLKSQLDSLLSKPLSARGLSHKYITSGSRGFVDALIQDQSHQLMIGVEKSSAKSDLEHAISKNPPLKKRNITTATNTSSTVSSSPSKPVVVSSKSKLQRKQLAQKVIASKKTSKLAK